MGNDISSNYDSITPIFIAGFWKVHSAVHKSTGELTSLWVLDDQILQEKCKNKGEHSKYIESCLYSIQQIRKLHHPKILKISEVNENPKQLAFSAEPVDSCLINEVNLEPDEVEYIASQLASAIFFLHHNAKIAHLNISPNSIIFTKALSLKLCGFNFSCNITGDSYKVFPRFSEWQMLPTLPDINFSAPEMVTNKTMTQSCDIFSFACVVASAYLKRHLFSFTTANEMIRTLNNAMAVVPAGATDSMRALLQNCLKINPEVRPTIDDILNSEAMNTLHLKVYNYMDVFLTKSQAEKFNFFKSLLPSLNLFSSRMLRYKFLPIFMNETISDSRFGPATIPLIFQIGAFFDRRDFMNTLFSPLSHLLTMVKPPEMLLSVFSVMKILLDRIDKEKHFELLYPIYTAALQSSDPRLHSTAVNYLPMIIKTLNTSILKSSLIPKIGEFIKVSQDPVTVSNCISVLESCLNRIDHDTFCEIALPLLIESWKRLSSDILAKTIIGILDQLNPTEMEAKLLYIIPLASLMLTNTSLESSIQLKLVNISQNIYMQLITERGLQEGNIIQQQNLVQQQNVFQQSNLIQQSNVIQQPQQNEESINKKTIQPENIYHQPQVVKKKSKKTDNNERIPSWSIKNKKPTVLPKQEISQQPALPPAHQTPIQKQQNSPKKQISPIKRQTNQNPSKDDFWGEEGNERYDDDVDKAIVEGILGDIETTRPSLKGPGFTQSGNKFQGRTIRYPNT